MGTSHLPWAAPAVPAWAVDRPRLLEAIDHATHALVVLRAGAGYGKTMLASQWAARHEGALWLDLQKTKNPLEALCVQAVRDAAHLILENYQPERPSLDRAIESLIEDRDASSRTLLLCRAEPRLHLARRKLEGTLLDFGPDELAFTEAEARPLGRAPQVQLLEERLELIMARTQGWPVGVRLAWQLFEAQGTLDGLSGALAPLIEYMEAELWHGLSLAEQDFMLSTAILTELHPEWCVALTGTSSPSLRELSLKGLPVLPPTKVDAGYRYHPLFREFLLTRLDERPQRRKGLERQAAVLLADRKRTLEATEHALAAGDWELATNCLRKSADRAFREGRREFLQRALERFPESYKSRPELLRVEGYLAWVEGDLEVALAKAHQAANSKNPDLRADALILEASAHYARGDFTAEQAALQTAIDAGPTEGHVMGKAWFSLGSLHFRAGRLAEAEEALRRAAQNTHEGDPVYIAVISLLPLLPLARGKPLAAAEGLGRAVKANHDFGNQRGEAYASYHLGIALNQAGMHERALEVLQDAARIADRLSLAHLAGLITREKADSLRDIGAAGVLDAYRQATTALEALSAASGLLHAYHGISVYHRRCGDADAARRAAEQALEHVAAGDMAFVALVRAHHAMLRANADGAVHHLNDVLAQPQRYYHALGLLYAASTDKSRAAEFTRGALTIIKDEGFERILETEKALAAPLLELIRAGPPQSGSSSAISELRLFGGLECRNESGERPSLRPQALQLLAYLALRRGATIDPFQIIEAIWPGHGEDRQATLQTLIWQIRHELGGKVIATRASGYAFDPDKQIWLDVETFGEHLRQARFEAAIELYTGELLPGVDWAELERRHLENQYLSALERLAAGHLETGQIEAGISRLEQVLAIDPFAEAAYEKLVACYQAAGRDDAARRLRREFHQNLEAALDA